MNNNIKKAIRILDEGGIIIFPTDTAFGIGCRIDNDKAIERLIKIRGRRKNQPLPVLVSDLQMAQKYLSPISENVKNLINKYWPGGLTIVLSCINDLVNPVIRGNGDTLGVRMPDNKIILDLIKKLGVPMIGCSANIPGEKTPFSISDIDKKLIDSVDFVIDGKCDDKQYSTVIDCSKDQWKILRQGAVKIQKIELIIDTASNEYITVGLDVNGKKYVNKQKIDFQKAQVVLPMIESILKKHELLLKDLTAVNVNEGPGSFTGLRVGISVANAISRHLNIPINNKKQGEIVTAIYK